MVNILTFQKYGYRDTYKASVDASVTNDFGIAFRYGHSNIHNIIGMAEGLDNNILKIENLADNFFNPTLYHKYQGTGHERVIQWTVATACPFTDR